MKKTSMVIAGLVALSSTSFVYAANTAEPRGVGQGALSPTVQAQQKNLYTSPSPTGIQVQNQNQIKTQNQGEEQKLQIQVQEVESENEENKGQGTSKDEAPRSMVAQQNMSIVAQKVEDLLTLQTTQGGIGEQIRLVAKEQMQAQDQIRKELEKVENRKGLLKSLIGPDFAALKNMQKQMEQNQLRIQELEQMLTQVNNQGDVLIIQFAIQALTDQKSNLTEVIATEERSKSMLGWLLRLFAR